MAASIVFTTDPENAPVRLFIEQKGTLFEVFAEVRQSTDLNQAQQKHLATYASLEKAKSFANQKRYMATSSLSLE